MSVILAKSTLTYFSCSTLSTHSTIIASLVEYLWTHSVVKCVF